MMLSPHVGQRFSRAADTYDAVAELQRHATGWVAERMGNGRILDLGCGTGELARKLPGGHIVQLDLAPGMCQRAALQGVSVCADAAALPFADASFDDIGSSLMLQWVVKQEETFAEMFRVLKPGGRLVAVTLGPSTLKELREAFLEIDKSPRVHEFLPVKALEGLAERAGFAGVKITVEPHVLNYLSVQALMRTLSKLGATNTHAHRHRGLSSASLFRRMEEAYVLRHAENEDSVPATWELVGIEAQKP
ncbi:MAG: methyltransferase domain-containing protein [Alphaproteobacteria bacterium]|nr:methyltransferase domain-containing protein [Alphaproteobacteria bacterium]